MSAMETRWHGGGKVWTIKFHESNEVWFTEIVRPDGEPERLQNASLAKLREMIDRRFDEKKQRIRIPVIVAGNYSMEEAFADAEVTSAVFSRYGRSNEYRVSIKTGKNKGPGRRHANSIYAATPENRAKIAKAAELRTQIAALEKERSAVVASMEPADLKAIGVEE